MKKSILALSLFVLGTSSAYAAEGGGLYLGAGVGQFNVEVDDIEDATNVAQDFDSDDTTLKIFGGWRFNPFIAVELDYIDLGSPSDTVGGLRVEAEINGFAPYLVATLPLGIFEVFGKVGYYFYDVKIDAANQRITDDSDEDLAYGAGIGVVLFDHLNARLEYEIIDISDVDDSNALWLSGAWRF